MGGIRSAGEVGRPRELREVVRRKPQSQEPDLGSVFILEAESLGQVFYPPKLQFLHHLSTQWFDGCFFSRAYVPGMV